MKTLFLFQTPKSLPLATQFPCVYGCLISSKGIILKMPKGLTFHLSGQGKGGGGGRGGGAEGKGGEGPQPSSSDRRVSLILGFGTFIYNRVPFPISSRHVFPPPLLLCVWTTHKNNDHFRTFFLSCYKSCLVGCIVLPQPLIRIPKSSPP